MNTKKLIILAVFTLTACLNIDAFAPRRAARRNALAGGYGYVYRRPIGYGLGTGVVDASLATAETAAAAPFAILS